MKKEISRLVNSITRKMAGMCAISLRGRSRPLIGLIPVMRAYCFYLLIKAGPEGGCGSVPTV
jgi:hypothetical protein